MEFNEYKVDCVIEFGSEKCGKPYLRKPIRQKLGDIMEGKHVEAFRSEQANELMTTSRDREAPIIRTAPVLYNVKNEHVQNQYISNNPFEALKILKYKDCVNCLEDIGYDPFFIHYGTNEALQTYKKLCAKPEKVSICIDSTAGLVKKLNSKNIFLHAVAVSIAETQFSVTHMLSEVSHAQAICNWLKMWRKIGAPVPDACVTDWSKALLHGVTNAFTKYETIEEYSDSLNTTGTKSSKIFIRIDIAHTLHKYAKYCAGLRKPIKTFYMACTGQLILCASKSEAENLIRKILTVCLSETDGNLKNGNASPCEEAKNFLLNLITKGNFLSEIFSIDKRV